MYQQSALSLVTLLVAIFWPSSSTRCILLLVLISTNCRLLKIISNICSAERCDICHSSFNSAVYLAMKQRYHYMVLYNMKTENIRKDINLANKETQSPKLRRSKLDCISIHDINKCIRKTQKQFVLTIASTNLMR